MPLIPDKSIVVFDMDGTLVDSMTHFGDIASDVITRFYDRDEVWARQAYHKTSGLPFPFQLEKLFPGDACNTKAAKEFFEKKAASYNNAPFYDDMEPTLRELKKQGYLTAISSNNEHDLLTKKVEDKKILFDLVCGFRPSFSKGKDHFAAIAKMLGVNFHEMLFVGDSLHDAQIARDNEVSFVAKLGTFSEGDFKSQGFTSVFVTHLSDLNALLNDATLKAYRHHGRGVRVEARR